MTTIAPAITTGSKSGPNWSAARVTTAAKKNEFAELGGGGGLSLTGATKRWTSQFRKSAETTVFIFDHYFGFPVPFDPNNPGVLAGIRTAGKVEDFVKAFPQIFQEYGKHIADNMAINGIDEAKIVQAIQALVNSGYGFLADIPSDEMGRRMHYQKAWLLYTAFTPLTVNVQLKPEKTAAVQTPVSVFRGGDARYGLLDLTPQFNRLVEFESEARKIQAKPASTGPISDPFLELAVLATVKNITPVVGQATSAGGIDVSAKVPPKGLGNNLENFRRFYNELVAAGKYMVVANVVNKKPVGFEVTPEGRYVHKSKVDLPGDKVIADYVYIADSDGRWNRILARMTNPNWAEHMAAAVRALSGDNNVTADMVRNQLAKPASQLKTGGSAAQSYVPGVSTRPMGSIARVPSPTRGTAPLATAGSGTIPLIGSPRRTSAATGLLGSTAFPTLGGQ